MASSPAGSRARELSGISTSSRELSGNLGSIPSNLAEPSSLMRWQRGDNQRDDRAPEEEYFVQAAPPPPLLLLRAGEPETDGPEHAGPSAAPLLDEEEEGAVCPVADLGQMADRLWEVESHSLRVATCWKRGDNTDPPCQVPRERTLPFHLSAPGGANAAPGDLLTLGQFLQTYCFNLRRQCANPKCRESVTRHEQVFSHHGGRLSIKVYQLPQEQAMPGDGFYAWTVCRACPNSKAGPRLPLSAATCNLSLGRFLESSFYNTVAASRQPGCPHSLHLHHERYVGYGSLACAFRFQQCVVFGITPPLPPRPVLAPVALPPPPPPPPSVALQLSSASAAAAHALGQSAHLLEVARGVAAMGAEGGEGIFSVVGETGSGGGESGGLSWSLNATASVGGGGHGGGRGGGIGAVSDLESHEKLCELMRWTDAVPKVVIRYDESEAAAERLLHGVIPVQATILYPANFAALRERFCEGGDAAFVTSLREAAPWYSGRGGKSGSTFLKTLDDRYLLKQVPRSELWAFHEHAPTYFSFVSKTPTTLPSALVKVLGAIVVEYRAAESGKLVTQYLLVQENLFYGKNVARMCDLKGAHRNRGGEDENETVLDENLFRFNNGYPLLLSEAAKQRLTRALWNDTLFLASINVMDYSLLVGMVQTSSGQGAHASHAAANAITVSDGRGEEWTLVFGVIDYCRQFTWKEEAESRIKRATVIQPKQYKRRFREALHRYFMASIEKYPE